MEAMSLWPQPCDCSINACPLDSNACVVVSSELGFPHAHHSIILSSPANTHSEKDKKKRKKNKEKKKEGKKESKKGKKKERTKEERQRERKRKKDAV